MKRCPICNTELRDDDVFCFGCGAEYKEPENRLTNCKFCGTKLFEGAYYCLYCGEPIYGGRNPNKHYPDD